MLLESLQALGEGLGERDVTALRRLSKNVIKKMAIEDGVDMLNVALVSYLFSKLLTKTHYWPSGQKKEFVSSSLKRVNKCIKAASKNDIRVLRRNLIRLLTDIRGLDLANPRYVQDTEKRARIKFASTLYAQGFSLSSAAAMAGIHKQGVLKYVGRTLIADRSGRTDVTMEDRLENVRKLFT